MDRFEEMQDMIAQEAFTKAGKKYEQLANKKSAVQIITDVLDAFKKASVKIDDSAAAARWLAQIAGNSTFAMSSGRIDGAPILISGTSSYMVNGFYFCVVKKNGKPRAVYVSTRAIAKLYNDDLSAIDPGRASSYVKKKRNLRNAEDTSHENNKDEGIAVEGLFGWGKKKQPKDDAQATAIANALNERYGKQMLELAREIANDFERRMKSNKAFTDNYEIDINDKTSSDHIISKKGIVDVVVIHWQGIVDAMAEMSNTDLYASDADDHLGDIFADRYAKEVNLDYYVRKYTPKAKAIHPSCTVKKMEEDIDMIYLQIDPAQALK